MQRHSFYDLHEPVVLENSFLMLAFQHEEDLLLGHSLSKNKNKV
jgi:hypothetical protein